MAVRLPNGRSPRQPLRTLCSLLPLSHHRPISLYSSIYPSTRPPHSVHPSHASNRDPPPFQARAASTPKGAALASKFRITSTMISGLSPSFIGPFCGTVSTLSKLFRSDMDLKVTSPPSSFRDPYLECRSYLSGREEVGPWRVIFFVLF